MEKIVLGKTGLMVSPLCIGMWQLAGSLVLNGSPDGHPDPGEGNVLVMLRELHERGLNFIDVAEQYGGGQGEVRTGKAIAADRDSWVVATKFGYRVGPNNTRNDSSHPDTIMGSLEGSLKRLRTDYIDVYLYHCPPKDDEIEGGVAILERAKTQGKIRFWGISTGNVDIASKLVDAGPCDVIQYPQSMIALNEAMNELAVKNHTGTMIRGIMAQGKLSGKYFHKFPGFGKDDNRSNKLKREDFAKYDKLETMVPAGYTMAQFALRYILDLKSSHAIVAGAKNLEDYKTMIAALELPAVPEPEIREILDALKKI